MIGLVGGLGRVGRFGRAPRVAVAAGPDFTLSATAVTTVWGVVMVGELTPNAATPAGAFFVLVDEPAGLAVVNG